MIFNRKNSFAGFFLFFTILGCKTTQQPAKPMEQYNERQMTEQLSVVNIPVRLHLEAFEKSLNEELTGVLYEDNDLKDGDKMMIRAEKQQDIKISFLGQTIQYQVPLRLWIKYDIGITNVEANGDIALNLKTDFVIQEDWSLHTITNVESYHWLKSPKLKMGSFNLPVGFIADIVLKNSKNTIASSIDEAIKESFDLRKMVQDTWDKMFDPLLVAPEYNTWLLVNPQHIGMTPLVLDQDTLMSTIFVESKPKVKFGEKPAKTPPLPLPAFKEGSTQQDDFVLFLSTEVPYTEAERIARAEMVGETFSEGKRTVTVEDIELYGHGNKIIVNAKLSGSYNGSIYLTGKPVYNANKNAIDIKDLDFTLETRNFLLKSGAWLLKSTIRKKLQENMNFLLEYNMNELKKQLEQQLSNYQVSRNIYLEGQLEALNIQDAFLAPTSIRVELAVKGRLNVQVKGLN